MADYSFVFVHGLSGWGSYDAVYRRMPYWGMRGGDLMAFLRGEGFPCINHPRLLSGLAAHDRGAAMKEVSDENAVS